MISVLVSDAALFVLTIISAYSSGHVTLSLALGGTLMILITADFITDSKEKLLIILQLLTAVLFAFCSGTWWGCSVFALLLFPKLWQSLVWSLGTLLILTLSLRLGLFGMSAGTHFWPVAVNEAVAGHEVRMRIAGFIAELFPLVIICLIFSLLRFLERSILLKKAEEERQLLTLRLGEMHEIQKNKELMRRNFYAEKNARLIERENLSRNIHNSVGHSITAAIMTLDAADVLFERKPEEAHKKMNEAAERIRGSLAAIRSAVRALDEEGEDISVKDLILYFDNILDEFLMDTDRDCERIYEYYDVERILPREHAEFLTGALEELLTNGVRHGGATYFTVRLSGDSAHLRMEVMDNGNSDFNEENREERIRNGFGLKKLTSYAERCGGHTEFHKEDGFCSVIELPI